RPGALWNEPWVIRDVQFGKRLHAVLTVDGTVHTARTFTPLKEPSIDTVNAVPSPAPRKIRTLQGLAVPIGCPAQERPLPGCAANLTSVSVSEVRANPRRFKGRWIAVRGTAVRSCGLSDLGHRGGRPGPPCQQGVVQTALPLP